MDRNTRNRVRRRARRCCEYCLLPERADPYSTFHLEHIVARQHGGGDEISNLAWACSRCNHRKGTNIASRDPDTGSIVELYNPRQQKWADHFTIRNGRIIGSSLAGRATARLLDMNDGRRVRLRRELIEQGEYPVS
jgi:HNH endonuclease